MIPNDDPIPSLLAFISEWAPGLTGKHRMPSEEVPAFVPQPLRAIYEHTGNYPVPNCEQWRAPDWRSGLFGPQDDLLPVDQLAVVDGRFRFIHENQGVWYCETDAYADDPPVYSDSRAYEHGEPAGTMRMVCNKLSHFLATYCLQELTFGSPHLLSVQSKVETPHELVDENIDRLWADGIYAFGAPTHSFFRTDSGLLIMDTDGSFWIGYRDDGSVSNVKSHVETYQMH